MTDQQQPQPRPPLWREMNAAQMALGYPLPQEMAYSDAISAMHMIRAAEISAMADEVAPECDCPDGDYALRAMWLARARVRDRLLDEADRAEAGE